MLSQPNPPDKRMKPKDGFDQHVQSGREIVAAAHVEEFVGNDRFKMSILKTGRNGSGPQKRWPENAEDAGFNGCFGESKGQRTPAAGEIFNSPQGGILAAF
jgi:hypothetical protein